MNDNGSSTDGTTGNTDTGDTTEDMNISTPNTSPSRLKAYTPGSGVKRSLAERKKEDLEGIKGITIKREIVNNAGISPPTQGRQKVVHNHTNVSMHSIGNHNIIHGDIVQAPVTHTKETTAATSPTSYTTEDLYGSEPPQEQMEIDSSPSLISGMTNSAEQNHHNTPSRAITISEEMPDEKTTAATELFKTILDKHRSLLDEGHKHTTEGNSYAAAAKSPIKQATIVEPVIVRKKYSFRLMWAFHSKHPKKQYVVARRRKGEILHTALKELLKAGIEISEDFALNTWDESVKAHTLQRPEDVPLSYDDLLKYVRPPEKGGIRQGETNNNWGIHATCGVKMAHFIGYWDEMRPYRRVDRIKSVFQPIRAAPLQDKEWYEIGWLVGATNKQYMDENMEQFQKQFPEIKIGINWQGIQFHRVQEHWKHAERMFRNNRDLTEKAKLSPTSYQILINKEESIGKVMKYMYEHHGKLGKNGTWPSMPDGSKLRFTPNHKYLKDQKGRNAISRRMALHIQMKWSNQTLETSIKNPGLKLPCLEGKSIGQVILEQEIEVDGQNEPYFRHFSRVWNRDPTVERWELCVHQHMYHAAKAKCKTMIKEMAEKYGDELYDAFYDGRECAYRMHEEQDEEQITFELDDDEDMYMSGKGNFQFQGIPNLMTKIHPTEAAKLRQMKDDAATSVGFSETEKQKETHPEDEHPEVGWTTVTRNRKARHKQKTQSNQTYPPSDGAEEGR